MNSFFTMTADFIDRMVNPSHGVLINQEYSLRFAELLTAEEDSIEVVLHREARRLADADVLTANGWLWFLTWARSEQIPLRESLLLDLTSKCSSAFIQTLAIEIALQGQESEEPQQAKDRRSNRTNVHKRPKREVQEQSPPSLFEFDHPFLKKLLVSVIGIDHDEIEGRKSDRSEGIRVRRSQTLLVALLEIDSELTRSAAATLLRHEWSGQKLLLEFYQTLESGLDSEARKEWRDRFHF